MLGTAVLVVCLGPGLSGWMVVLDLAGLVFVLGLQWVGCHLQPPNGHVIILHCGVNLVLVLPTTSWWVAYCH